MAGRRVRGDERNKYRSEANSRWNSGDSEEPSSRRLTQKPRFQRGREDGLQGSQREEDREIRNQDIGEMVIVKDKNGNTLSETDTEVVKVL